MRSPAPLLRNNASAIAPGPADLTRDGERGRRPGPYNPAKAQTGGVGPETARRAGRRRARVLLLGVAAVVVVLATVMQPVVTVTILVGVASAWYAFAARWLLRRPAAGASGTQVEDAK